MSWTPSSAVEASCPARRRAGVVASNSAARVARLYDQHGQFLSLEGGLFTLGLPDTYLQVRHLGAGRDAPGEGQEGHGVGGMTGEGHSVATVEGRRVGVADGGGTKQRDVGGAGWCTLL